MIEAPIGAVPGLLAFFLLLAALFALPVRARARKRGRPTVLPVAFAVSLAGVTAVTLLPGRAGTSGRGTCDDGCSVGYLLGSPSALLNVGLFVLPGFLALLLFRRPLTVAASIPLSSACIEFAQVHLVPGRSCSLTDLVANSVGGLAAAAAATLLLLLSRRGLRGGRRDLAHGSGAVAATAVLLVAIFHSSAVTTYDDVAEHRLREARGSSAMAAEEWIAEAAAATFGTGTRPTGTRTEWLGDRVLVTAETDRGSISGWWPDKQLKDARSHNGEGGPGDLDREQARALGADFARTWFPRDVRGSRETVDTVAGRTADRALHVLTYHRHTGGVAEPAHLEITVSSAGRILGFSARSAHSAPDAAHP